ncbi:hypothetical protein D9X30_4637 (plasmid) [Cupriavidus sp. U2]|uniref:hypothetical protein n=1 Tax=Cupriavidus sp. U2 TaxID=2920269 RepID=UPI00129D58EF|nr:hypothetical protein [Cupriavidus sp. U2]KAI3590404.1 hypothetical protein D9X30_4637 [Cupriavidus sp. U2]
MARRFKVGMWNRFAIVVTLAISIGFPIYFKDSQDSNRSRLHAEVLMGCIHRMEAARPGANVYPEASDICSKEASEFMRTYGSSGINSPSKFLQAVLFTLFMCGLGYVGIRLLVGIGRWILRGRSANELPQ